MKIDTASWGEFRIDELFDVVYGVNLELVNCTETSIEDPEAIAFVSRTESNNGISGYVKPVLGGRTSAKRHYHSGRWWKRISNLFTTTPILQRTRFVCALSKGTYL